MTLSLCKTPRAQKVRMAQNPGRGSSAALGRAVGDADRGTGLARSEEHTSELQSLMRISYAVFCLKKKQMNCRLCYTIIDEKQRPIFKLSCSEYRLTL